MATVQGYTTAHVDGIEDQLIVSAVIDGSGHLILTKNDSSTIDAGAISSSVSDASTTVKGKVELADGTETAALSDTTRAVTPGGLASVIGPMNTAISGKQASDSDLTAIAGLSPAANDFMQYKSSAWANRTVAQVKTDLAISNVDNTSDASKPVSTAQNTAIAKKPDVYLYNGSAYAQVTTGAVDYVGPVDPAASLTVVNGSVWLDTSA
jgi:hypothetical protein